MIHPKLEIVRLPPDARGTIAKLALAGTKFNVLYSRAGSLRAGDYHPCWQYDLVLSGSVEITRHLEGLDLKEVVGTGVVARIPPDVPHLFRFLDEDCVMVEWWQDGFSCQYYEPYRLIVENYIKQQGGVH